MKIRIWSLTAALAAALGAVAGTESGFAWGVGAYDGDAAFRHFRVTDATGKVVYANDFTDPASIRDWKQTNKGTWTVRQGELVLAKGGGFVQGMSLQLPTRYRNTTVSFQARRVKGPEGFLVAVDETQLSGGEWVIFGGWNNREHGIEIDRYMRHRIPGSIEAGRWYDVKVEGREDGVRAWLDGKLVLQAKVKPPIDEAVVACDAAAKPVTYDPMIFGQFLEHHDRQVYGGVFDPGNRFSDKMGLRTDVAAALREIRCPIVRWPGGCFVSSYHWRDGVGRTRAETWDKAWRVYDPNTFGTDEFVAWCRLVGCEPYICTNAGTGSEEEMSDWVEYCNLPRGKFAKMRAANGHPEPFNVKYWSIGNENWGGHEIGAKTVGQWGPLVCESAKLMRAVTRDLKLLAAALANEGWTGPLLDRAGPHLDYVSIHGYWAGSWTSYLDLMARTGNPEGDILRTIEVLKRHRCYPRVKIAYDEWNPRGWHHPGLGNFRGSFDYPARRENDIARIYTMADAVFSACFLNACLRHADVVTMACFSPCVNTRGCIFAHKDGIVKRTTWHVFKMYTHLLAEQSVPVQIACGQLRNQTPVLDGVLTVSKDGTRRVLAIANKHPDKPVKLDVTALTQAKSLKATVLAGDSANAYNDIGAENRVVATPCTLAVENGRIALPAHSVCCIELACAGQR